MAAICRSTIIKEGTPFTSEWSLRSLRNSHAVYVGIYIPFISEWLRRSAGICTIPCETQAIKWSVASRERYYNIAAKCDKETMLQREYTSDCMDKRNRYMVDHADYILAVWNGCPSGTGNTVRYAHKKGKSIIVINPVSLDVTRE